MKDRRRKEDKKLLDEYVKKEVEKVEKLSETMVEKAKRGEEVSFADLYPEWNLRERMPYTWRNPDIPLEVMLPYYNTLIVDIVPHFSKQRFRKLYGCDVEELLRLEKEGKVVLRFNPSTLITRGMSDYLRPIFEEGLEKGRPSPIRAVFYACFAKELIEPIEKSEMLFRGKFPKGIRDPGGRWDFSAKELEELSIGMYFNFKLFGFDQVAEYVKRAVDLDPYLAFYIMAVYSDLLVGPKVNSLDGIHSIPREEIEFLSSLVPQTKISPLLKTGKYEIFPYDVGKVLVKKAKLVVRKDLGDALDVYKDYEKARKALFSLEKAVEEKEKILERAKALEETWNELVSMEEMRGKRSAAFTTVGLVGSGAAEVCLSQQPGLLSLLLGMFLSAFSGVVLPRISSWLAERTVKMGKSSNIVFVYDFVRERNPEAFRSRNIDL